MFGGYGRQNEIPTGSSAEFPFESVTMIFVPGLPLVVVTLVTVKPFVVPAVGATVAIAVF